MRELNHCLQRDGVEAFFDKESIEVGSTWTLELQKGLDETDFIIIVLSPDYVASDWGTGEWTSL
ncbi:MAG: toll/interleukin-1 receptor domain-containing protein [Synechococcus sp.]